MKCPSCRKPLNPRSHTCKYCGVRLARKSDKMVRKMTTNGRIAMASGGLLVLISVVLMLNSALFFGGVTIIIGGILITIGKMMD